jgi:hypothetical protein
MTRPQVVSKRRSSGTSKPVSVADLTREPER